MLLSFFLTEATDTFQKVYINKNSEYLFPNQKAIFRSLLRSKKKDGICQGCNASSDAIIGLGC